AFPFWVSAFHQGVPRHTAEVRSPPCGSPASKGEFAMKLHALLLAVVIVMCGVPAAFADPVIITGGSVGLASIMSGYQPPFGFSLTGDQTDIGGSTYDGAGGFLNVGDVVNLSRSVHVF